MLSTSRWLTGLGLAAAITTISMTATAADSEAAQDSTLSGDEIREQVWGHSVQGTMSDGQRYDEAYGQNGSIKGDGYTGQASLQGDRMCLDYGSGETTCYQVRRDGEQRIKWLENGDVAGDGVISETPDP